MDLVKKKLRKKAEKEIAQSEGCEKMAIKIATHLLDDGKSDWHKMY